MVEECFNDVSLTGSKIASLLCRNCKSIGLHFIVFLLFIPSYESTSSPGKRAEMIY